MPWGWAIAADFQLYLIVPFVVIAFKRSRNLGFAIMWFLLIAGTAIVMGIAYKFELSAGFYTLENWYLYGSYLNKPYCKFQLQAIGFLFAALYLDIIKYR